MKVIAVINIPEGGKGKWYINDEIRYTENESLMKKFDKEMIPLKPMPQYKNPKYSDTYGFGWNDCLKELEKC